MPSTALLSVFHSTSYSILTTTWYGGDWGFQADTAVDKRRSRIWTRVFGLWVHAQAALLATWLLISSVVWGKLSHLQECVSWSVENQTKPNQTKYFFILDQLVKKTKKSTVKKKKKKENYVYFSEICKYLRLF